MSWISEGFLPIVSTHLLPPLEAGMVTQSKPVGLADTDYARRTRALIKAIGESRALGGQGDLDLPSIAVIGNQSAGKSSLIEAITGITVPRATGTCTRCPMECRLQQVDDDSPWRAQVLLRLEKDANGRKMLEIREEPFGPVVYDTMDLEMMIRRAQFAILNPSTSARFFESLVIDGAPSSITSSPELKFSSNVICIDVSGPNMPDLTFTDLPGIISNEDEPGSIEAVRSMVMTHIRGNCLILLTITMRDDVANQSAAFLARQVDPEGSRTIGVLTKPDLLSVDEEHASGWVDVLENRSHRLVHGYYITKQPTNNELSQNLSFDEARRREKAYFDGHPTWSTRSDATKKRMGTTSLARSLSKLLSNLIDRTLPKLREDLRKLQQRTRAEIRDLPKPLSREPVLELRHLVTLLIGDIDRSIQGLPGHEGLIYECNTFYEELRSGIKRTAPVFVPEVRKNTTHLQPITPMTKANDAPRSSGLEIAQESISYSFRRENLPETCCPEPAPYEECYPEPPTVKIVDIPNNKSIDLSDDGDTQVEPMYLNELKTWIDVRVTRELPGSIPFGAKVALILHSFEEWHTITKDCSAKVFSATEALTLRFVEKHFQRYSFSSLNEVVKNTVDQSLDTFKESLDVQLAWLVEIENPPYTQNNHYFASYRDKYLTHYKSKRPSINPINPHQARAAFNNLRSAGYDIESVEDLVKLRREDPFEREMLVAAEVRAYFQVAYKRLIDNVPRAIDYFLRGLGAKIEEALTKKLLANGSLPAASYIKEDPVTALRREELMAKEIRLREISAKLIGTTG